ncbi:MAG: NADH-quinone oxidoreductase subunit A [Candidatus Odinarchaeota archaeon]
MLDVIWVPIAFIIILIATAAIYAWGRRVAPPSRKKGEALETYACGEEQTDVHTHFRINWFYYAVYFMIFDIIAFILTFGAFQLGILPAVYAVVLYGAVSLIAIIVLLRG